jgi:hypothetical protein
MKLLSRIRALDIRLLAGVAAALMLVAGVMWVVPTTPNSSSFTFDTNRRGISSARVIEFGKPLQGNIVDGSDFDLYRVTPFERSTRLDVHMTNGSPKLIPGLLIFDAMENLVQDKTTEYVKKPGTAIETSFLAEANTMYYLQVLSQRNTIGPYTLTVSVQSP